MKNFSRKIRKRFEQRLNPAFARFEQCKEFAEGPPTYPTWRVLESDGLFGYLLLKIEGNKEKFNTWLAVMPEREKSPDYARMLDGIRQPVVPFGRQFPLCHLWTYGNWDTWWKIYEPDFAAFRGYEGLRRTGFCLSPDECRAWIEQRPELYAGIKLDADDHILLPHVDQMLDCLIECAIPYFDSVAAGTDQEPWLVATPPPPIKRYKISEHM
jgi:hypothetical protein